MTNEELLELDVDVLIPAALEGVVNAENAPNIKAKVVLELANGPVTPEGEAILNERGILVVPDVLANSGGVTVSCFEWIQGRTGDFWTEDEVHQKLDKKLTKAFQEIWKIKKEKDITFRQAAYVRAVDRITSQCASGVFWPDQEEGQIGGRRAPLFLRGSVLYHNPSSVSPFRLYESPLVDPYLFFGAGS